MIYTNSRYKDCDILYTDKGTPYLSQREDFSPETVLEYYTFKEGDTLDGLAYKYYGDASLWWSILDANPVYTSEIEIEYGDVLAIPTKREVLSR